MYNNKIKSLVLPSDNSKLKEFISNNKMTLMKQVIDSIELGLKNNLEIVEIFKFEDCDFVVTLNRENFHENIKNIFDNCIREENYEICKKIKSLNLMILSKNL